MLRLLARTASGGGHVPSRDSSVVSTSSLCEALQCDLAAAISFHFQVHARNVAYNAVCLFYKAVEGFDAKHGRLNRTRIVLGEHLVKYWRDVHCVGVQSTCSCEMTMLPAGVSCWSFASQPMTHYCACLNTYHHYSLLKILYVEKGCFLS
ncbi:hypothetical protein IG631_02235 [Alternaria alternata]|nr:hypothetical protein IG631_02235 [Alternaria alternata]